MKFYTFEIFKLRKLVIPIAILTFVSQLFITYFFAVIGQFEDTVGDQLLKSYSVVVGLASTITMCVVSIYGSTRISRYIVKDYIGDNRNRVFLYPIKRSQLYFIKNRTFGFILGFTQVLFLLLANIFFLIGETLFPIMEKPLANHWINLIFSILACALITLSIIFFSSLVGIYFSSTINTVVASIISVVVMANILALALINFQFSAFIGALSILLVALLMLSNTGKQIDKTEVF
ncbi:hypothetical protein [Carnobacterium maltaromaticum]|uniref:hypothetical protein n=1 Tax=Carnobacterium maltaromaticum TaxID=2751 RepID=UPI001071CB5C|nr:hypothetical protein [Carnobacterium maltaromaticum]TFJ76086.1 hypothetical protein CKN94_04420 [Carnobacterium maltaromaticum]TFJ79027.1 hypothetical protein CKN97_04415 [Carnobacterium maltaromaticum]